MKKCVIGLFFLLIFLFFLLNLGGKSADSRNPQKTSVTMVSGLEKITWAQKNGYISKELYMSVKKSVNSTGNVEMFNNEGGKIKRALKLSMSTVILSLSELLY